MHDGWKPYDVFTDCRHVLCNAHLLRDLQGIIDSTGEKWAKQCRSFSRKLCIKKTIQRNSAKSRTKEAGYHLSIHIERKGVAFFRLKKEKKTDACSKFMESLRQI
ncbi:IS66 family transposase [Bacillus cereus]